ncbi:cytochrome P450 [Mycena vulgaris]|nr:cytochrome P450 [Mycena vulgaris]
MSLLSPGVRFLGRNLIVPALSILLIQGCAIRLLGLPMWTALGFAIIAGFVFVVSRSVFIGWARAREARAMGARLVPCAQGTRPGNVDILRKILRAYASGYLGEAFAELVESLGSVLNIRMLGQDKIFTVSPEHVQIILATDFKNYVKGKNFCYGMDSVLGNGVFNSDGEMWSFHRSMTRPYFARDRVQHFDIFDRHSDQVISLIRNRMAEGHAIDFQDLISRFTIDSATEFLFGECIDSLACTPPYPHNASAALPPPRQSPRALEANAFTDAYSEAMLRIAFRQRVGWVWPLFEMFRDKTAAPMEVVTKYIDPIIHAALEKKTSLGGEAKDEDEGASLLDDLLKSTSDPKVLKDEILNILIAGRDTTMSVLTNVIYFLSVSPAVIEKLRAEITEVMGDGRPTYDNIKQMKYLRAVLNETMRLYPPVPFNIRQSIKATTWPSPDPNEKPLYIPAGVGIVYSVMLMQRRKDLWGPDADNFDPDRFVDERAKRYISHPFQFLPFNAGPRICLGQQFAYNEMSFVLIKLLQNFSSIALDVDACPPQGRVPPEWRGQAGRKGVEQFVPKAHLTMYTLGGLWVKMGNHQES